MTKDSKELVLIGAKQLATKNDVTVRIRLFFKDTGDNIYSIDLDTFIPNFDPLNWNKYSIKTDGHIGHGILHGGLP